MIVPSHLLQSKLIDVRQTFRDLFLLAHRQTTSSDILWIDVDQCLILTYCMKSGCGCRNIIIEEVFMKKKNWSLHSGYKLMQFVHSLLSITPSMNWRLWLDKSVLEPVFRSPLESCVSTSRTWLTRWTWRTQNTRERDGHGTTKCCSLVQTHANVNMFAAITMNWVVTELNRQLVVHQKFQLLYTRRSWS